jgi:hypothetical protein
MSEYYAGGSFVPGGSTGSSGAIPTSGQISISQFYGSGIPVYIEEVFNTSFYVGTSLGNTQTITNGIDFANKGGLLWCKSRSGFYNNYLFDTARGQNKWLASNSNGTEQTNSFISFGSNGFTINGGFDGITNDSTSFGSPYVSWSFRKQPKFFDIVTWTGVGGGTDLTLNHNLGSTPGCIIVKARNLGDSPGYSWFVYHRGLASGTNGVNGFLRLETSAAEQDAVYNLWNPTSTTFRAAASLNLNTSGGTFVAYLWAHNAGNFGLNGTDNVVTCGVLTTDGSGNSTTNLGYEPQWIMIKSINRADDWKIFDADRGWNNLSDGTAFLIPNSTSTNNYSNYGGVLSDGFRYANAANETSIYIAIRRGPMKLPTSGTQVYNAVARTGTGSTVAVTGAGFSPDLTLIKYRSGGIAQRGYAKLGSPRYRTLAFNGSDPAVLESDLVRSFDSDGITFGNGSDFGSQNYSGFSYINWFFRRNPGVFDMVPYRGNGSARTVAHSLGVVPQLMFIKKIAGGSNDGWYVYSAAYGVNDRLVLNSTEAATGSYNYWNSTRPTSSVLSLGASVEVNQSGSDYIALLFASRSGISKVPGESQQIFGNGGTLNVDCGFASSARFVMIKRTDQAGPWYVWDSTRGINSAGSSDPHLQWNDSVAEASADSIAPFSTGFTVIQNSTTNINISGALYLYIAIA